MRKQRDKAEAGKGNPTDFATKAEVNQSLQLLNANIEKVGTTLTNNARATAQAFTIVDGVFYMQRKLLEDMHSDDVMETRDGRIDFDAYVDWYNAGLSVVQFFGMLFRLHDELNALSMKSGPAPEQDDSNDFEFSAGKMTS